MRKQPPRVEIEWRDIYQRADWMTREERDGFAPVPVRTIGYLIYDDGDILKVSNSEAGELADCTVIPRGCVSQIWRLKRDGRYTQP